MHDKKYLTLVTLALTIFGASVANPAIAQPAELYENLDVQGTLLCKADSGMTITVAEKRKLDCEYKTGADGDVLRKFVGVVSKRSTDALFLDEQYLSWTVLYLKRKDDIADPEASVVGRYARAWPAIIEEYELKPNTLVGGERNLFALEPRHVDGRKSDELAASVLYFELKSFAP